MQAISRRQLFSAAVPITGALLSSNQVIFGESPSRDWDTDKLSSAVTRATMEDARTLAYSLRNRLKTVNLQSQAAQLERSTRTLFAQLDEIGLAKHLNSNIESYSQRPTDAAAGLIFNSFHAAAMPLSIEEVTRMPWVASLAKRDEAIQRAKT